MIAKEKFKPDYFLYENNKSAAQAIKNQISHELGVDLQYINSALVSAQNRQRFYAHNIPNVEQPMDRGILLKDILENYTNEKGYKLAEPVCVAQRGRLKEGKWEQQFEPRFDGTTNTITTVTKDNLVGESIRIGTIDNNAKNKDFDSKQYRVYSPEGKSTTICGQGGGVGAKTGLYACPIQIETEKLSEQYYHGDKDTNVFGKIECKNTSDNNGQPVQGTRIYRTDRKFICLDADSRKYIIDQYKDNFVDLNGKEIPIYEVKNGLITIKDKTYPIKLADGYYIIRKLTPIECERLQTLPDNYTAGISNSQRYKCIGNGWTAEVIIHILKHMNIPLDEEIQVLSMYDGIGTGRYCFDKLGYKNITYKAYEIDKYAKQVANKNYSDIIQCGDAFDLRNENWCYEKQILIA